MGRVLIVEDDRLVARSLSRTFRRQGHEVETAGSVAEAQEQVASFSPDVAIVDERLPDGRGIEVLNAFTAYDPDLATVMLTGVDSVGLAWEALKSGAFAWFRKPLDDPGRFHRTVRDAMRPRPARASGSRSAREHLAGPSPAMDTVRDRVTCYAPAQEPVLILGQTGTGKEVAARAIHSLSGRKGRFLAVNCANLTGDRLEGELFGWERGSFTGASSQHEGAFEQARGGTIFLDEIGDMAPALQARLLRVLGEGEYRRIGGRETLRVQARVVSATHVDLRKAVEEGRFRRDLYYRLAVLELELPSLAERREDVPELVVHLLRRLERERGGRLPTLKPSVVDALAASDWPGNVRQLEHAIRRAIVLARGEPVSHKHFGLSAVRVAAPVTNAEAELSMDMTYVEFKDAVVEASIPAYLRHQLLKTGGNITRAAELAGMARPNFSRLLKRWDVQLPQ